MSQKIYYIMKKGVLVEYKEYINFEAHLNGFFSVGKGYFIQKRRKFMYEDFRMKLIYLSHCEGVGWKTIFSILKKDPTLKHFQYSFHESTNQNPSCNKLTTYPKNFSVISDQIRQYSYNGIHVITYFDDEYPDLLKEIFQPPWVIYAKGDLSLLVNKPKLAVVGARQATEYSRKSIEYLFPNLIKNDVIIVSGLASGVDSIAHRVAIQLSGKTIGVIAGGFYHIYPKENKNLALFMMRNHLVISEYPPHVRPSKWQFPMRNRIISGISSGTLIIEAKRRSGSLITANYALNEGREVFAVPGNIQSPSSIGTNELIQQGAKLVMNSSDILEEIVFK